MAILEVRNVYKSFGGNLVLEDVSMNAELGQVTSLIGPNGAGKSTLLNIVSGFLKADSGSVVMDGREIIGSPPFKCFKAGIARTFQDSQVLYYMNGLDNVVVSSPGQRGELEYNALLRPGMVAAEESERRAEAMGHLTELNIQSKAASLSQALSYGQQKLLEFARMLNSRAQVFLLDEPMAGIHPDLIAGLSEMIRSAAVDHGKAVILVEHNLKVVMDVSDYVVVVRGEGCRGGPAVRSRERRTPHERVPGIRVQCRYLRPQDLLVSYGPKQILNGVSMGVDAGKVTTIVGHNGAGKSTLIKGVYGVARVTGGSVTFDGHDITNHAPYDNIKDGMGYLAQGGQVFADLPVEDNLKLGGYALPNELIPERLEQAYQMFPILDRRRRSDADTLSGGERQMLAIAMTLMLKPKLMLMDEPSGALAGPILEQISAIIRSLVEEVGIGILLVEQNVEMGIRGRGQRPRRRGGQGHLQRHARRPERPRGPQAFARPGVTARNALPYMPLAGSIRHMATTDVITQEVHPRAAGRHRARDAGRGAPHGVLHHHPRVSRLLRGHHGRLRRGRRAVLAAANAPRRVPGLRAGRPRLLPARRDGGGRLLPGQSSVLLRLSAPERHGRGAAGVPRGRGHRVLRQHGAQGRTSAGSRRVRATRSRGTCSVTVCRSCRCSSSATAR